jgi:hypothetical protein
VTSSIDHTQLINSTHNNRIGSLVLTSKSNEHSPRHNTSLLTPTNHEQSTIRKIKSVFERFLFNLCSDNASFLSIFIRIK